MAWQDGAESCLRDNVTPCVRRLAIAQAAAALQKRAGEDKLTVNRQRALVVVDANCILGCQS